MVGVFCEQLLVVHDNHTLSVNRHGIGLALVAERGILREPRGKVAHVKLYAGLLHRFVERLNEVIVREVFVRLLVRHDKVGRIGVVDYLLGNGVLVDARARVGYDDVDFAVVLAVETLHDIVERLLIVAGDYRVELDFHVVEHDVAVRVLVKRAFGRPPIILLTGVSVAAVILSSAARYRKQRGNAQNACDYRSFQTKFFHTYLCLLSVIKLFS